MLLVREQVLSGWEEENLGAINELKERVQGEIRGIQSLKL